MLEISFPGNEGIPYRGQQLPLLKQAEFEQLEEVLDAESRTFDLAREEDRVAYNQVCDNAAKKIAFLRVHVVNWPETRAHPRIFVAWLNRYAERPGSRFERVTKDANGQISFRSR